jgi:hypothetical protein
MSQAPRLALPPPSFPLVTRVYMKTMLPPDRVEKLIESGAPVPNVDVWQLSQPHPFISGMRVTRMFLEDDCVAIYSSTEDGSSCVRNTIPMSAVVHLVEEAMPLEVWIQEIYAAEEGPVDDDDDSPEDESEPAAAAAAANVAT